MRKGILVIAVGQSAVNRRSSGMERKNESENKKKTRPNHAVEKNSLR